MQKRANKEVWKDVVGYEGFYKVSNLGRVKSLDRYVGHPQKGEKGRLCKSVVLKQKEDKDGYKKVNLKKKQKGNTQSVHRLVAQAFIENPLNKPQVNHINGVKSYNVLKNLEWATSSENRQHAYNAGLQNGMSRQGVKNNFNKLSDNDIDKIRFLIKEGKTQKLISSMFCVSQSCISMIKRNKRWAWK